jgi:hypothetical protein
MIRFRKGKKSFNGCCLWLFWTCLWDFAQISAAQCWRNTGNENHALIFRRLKEKWPEMFKDQADVFVWCCFYLLHHPHLCMPQFFASLQVKPNWSEHIEDNNKEKINGIEV